MYHQTTFKENIYFIAIIGLCFLRMHIVCLTKYDNKISKYFA